MQIPINPKIKKYLDNIQSASIRDKNSFHRFDLAEGSIKPSNVVINTLKDFNSEKLSSLPTEGKARFAISKFLNIEEEMITLFNGVDSALENLGRILDYSNNIFVINPDYARLSTCFEKNGYKVNKIKINISNNYVDEIKNTIKELDKKSILLISNPNNPTGRIIPINLIDEIAEKVKLLIIDESYQEYFSINPQDSSASLIEKHKNIIVLRSFSKYFCLAGIRLGYVVTNEEFIKLLDKFKLKYEVSQIAQDLGEGALASLKYFNDAKETIDEQRRLLISAIESNKNLFYISNSVTNFILVKHKLGNLFELLLRKKTLVNQVKNLDDENGYCRICLQTPEQNKFLFDILSII